MAKKKDVGGSTATKNQANSKKTVINRVLKKSQSAPPKDNPFQTIRANKRRGGLARSRAIDKANWTVLKELEQSGRASRFVKLNCFAKGRELKKLLKHGRKGAIRVLKKGNAFVHELKEKERANREEERAEQYGKTLAFLQEQGQLGKRWR